MSEYDTSRESSESRKASQSSSFSSYSSATSPCSPSPLPNLFSSSSFSPPSSSLFSPFPHSPSRSSPSYPKIRDSTNIREQRPLSQSVDSLSNILSPSYPKIRDSTNIREQRPLSQSVDSLSTFLSTFGSPSCKHARKQMLRGPNSGTVSSRNRVFIPALFVVTILFVHLFVLHGFSLLIIFFMLLTL